MTTSVALLLVLVGCYGELSEDQRRRAALPCRPFNESDPLPRALVTGGVGFVGHHLITRLVGQGLAGRVLVVDNLWRGSLENALDDAGGELIDLEHDMCVEDLTVPGVADRVVGGADVIFHLADIVAGVDYVFKNQPFVFDRNLEINLAVARAARKASVREFVYTGTACSFPKGLQGTYNVTAISENMTYPADPESAYGWSKLMGEYQLGLEREPGVFDVGIVRFHNLYGPRSRYDSGAQALPSLTRRVLKLAPGRPLQVWGSGRQYRDFLFVADAVDAVLAVWRRGMNSGPIQVGTGVATTLREAAKAVAGLAAERRGFPIDIVFDASKPEGDRGRVAELTRARSLLDWTAVTPLAQGLRRMFDWIADDLDRATAARAAVSTTWNYFATMDPREFGATLVENTFQYVGGHNPSVVMLTPRQVATITPTLPSGSAEPAFLAVFRHNGNACHMFINSSARRRRLSGASSTLYVLDAQMRRLAVVKDVSGRRGFNFLHEDVRLQAYGERFLASMVEFKHSKGAWRGVWRLFWLELALSSGAISASLAKFEHPDLTRTWADVLTDGKNFGILWNGTTSEPFYVVSWLTAGILDARRGLPLPAAAANARDHLAGVGGKYLHNSGTPIDVSGMCPGLILAVGHNHLDILPSHRSAPNATPNGNTYFHYFVAYEATPPFRHVATSPAICFAAVGFTGRCEVVQFVTNVENLPDDRVLINYGINECTGGHAILDVLALLDLALGDRRDFFCPGGR